MVETNTIIICDRASLARRFASKHSLNPATGCWEWTASLNPAGYGQIQTGKRPNIRCSIAHRVSWILNHGDIPDNLHVLHRCDNPKCVNPEHLFLGTHSDNMADMVAKGRSGYLVHPELVPRGENHGMAKLNEQSVRSIRRLLADGKAVRALARMFSVDRKAISMIRDNLTWKHVA